MPKHIPIRFKSPSVSEEVRERIEKFTEEHPTSYSAVRILIGLAMTGGLLTVSAVAPNAVATLLRLKNGRAIKKEGYAKLWQAFRRLETQRAIKYCGMKNGEALYEFTNNGKKKIRVFAFETLNIERPVRWDGQWRIVIFDIPEYLGTARRALQKKLQDLGFYPLQKSVWVYPFPCEAEIEFVKDFFGIGRFVYVLSSNEMPSAKVLYHFQNLLA